MTADAATSSSQFAEAVALVPIVAVMRGLAPGDAMAVGGAAVKGGLRAVEVTLDSPGALEAIARLVEVLPSDVVVGAGTVVSADEVDAAVDAGAAFVVAPHLDVTVVSRAVAAGIPAVPGVVSPTELHAAYLAGAAMVKLFPAAALGVGYLSALRGPYPNVPIMVSGGVTVDAVSGWLNQGANVAGIGVSALGRTANEVQRRVATLVTSLTS